MKEQEHHKKAFEYYYTLGESRSLPKVAARLGVSLASVKLWSRSFDWHQRLNDRDAEVARAMASRALSDEVENRARNKQLVKMALLQLAKAIAEGKIKMTLADLDKLIRLEAFLNEKPKRELDPSLALGIIEDQSPEEALAELDRDLGLLGFKLTKTTGIETAEPCDEIHKDGSKNDVE